MGRRKLVLQAQTMNKDFPDSVFFDWHENDKNRLRWLIKLGVPIEIRASYSPFTWHLDEEPNPDKYWGHCYRVKK